MMKTDTQFGKTSRLRATVSMTTTVGVTPPAWEAEPLFRRDTGLPTEVTHSFPNGKEGQSEFERLPILICLFFGENKAAVDNLCLGEFSLKGIPPAPVGPGHIDLKISINTKQVLCLAVKDPAVMEYRSIAFIYLSLLEPPAIVEPASKPHNFKQGMEVFFKTFLEPTPRAVHLPRDGKDITHNLSLTFEEALHGVQKNIEVTRAETCPTCSGSGARPGTETVTCTACQGTGLKKTEKRTTQGKLASASFESCPTCKGTGKTIPNPCVTCQGKTWVNITRPLTVNIPAGIDSGAEVRFPGKGEAGWNGGRAGYLSIGVAVIGHPLFTRLGRAISIRLPVQAKFAKTGGQLQIPGVEGGSFCLLKLPPDTRNGVVFRISESEAYTFDAIIATYTSLSLLVQPEIRERLQAIKEALNGRELEIQM